jgi:hypothetical protein
MVNMQLFRPKELKPKRELKRLRRKPTHSSRRDQEISELATVFNPPEISPDL